MNLDIITLKLSYSNPSTFLNYIPTFQFKLFISFLYTRNIALYCLENISLSLCIMGSWGFIFATTLWLYLPQKTYCLHRDNYGRLLRCPRWLLLSRSLSLLKIKQFTHTFLRIGTCANHMLPQTADFTRVDDELKWCNGTPAQKGTGREIIKSG